jgi:ABC-type transport system substrate-binding protein
MAALLIAGAVLSLGLSPGQAQSRPLRYLHGEAGTLDPAFIGSASDVQLLLQLYAGLSRLDEQGEPYPSLAEGWSVSDDGREYTFRLREGLRFSDGSTIDAEDFRRSWLRLLDPATESTAPDVLSVVEGATERLAGIADEDEVGIEAPDPRTFVVRLRHPAAYFPAITATPATFVVPEEADASDAWQRPGRSFVGSGPYVADSTEGPSLVLQANPEYVAGPPPIEEVVMVGDLETDPVTAFAGNQLDLTQVFPSDATWLAYDADLGPNLHLAAPMTIGYIGFDTTQPPFDDRDVRRAFALALDRPRLVELSAGASGRAAPSLVPPALWTEGWEEEIESDADEARRLLDQAGYEDRADLGEIVVNASGVDMEGAAAAWREELGVEVSLEVMDFADYLASLDEGTAPPVFTSSWIADYVSPHAIYSLLLVPGAVSNWGGWEDDEFVRLLEEAAAAEDEEARAEAYAAVDERVDEEAPVVPWLYGDDWWLTHSELRGLGTLTVGLLDLGRVSWDE